jgi:hypothetical protein
MKGRRCRYCRQVFQPAPYHPQQQVCGNPACQSQRRRDYHRQKIASDPVYQQVLFGEPAEVAQGEPGLLEEISPEAPGTGRTKSPTAALT